MPIKTLISSLHNKCIILNDKIEELYKIIHQITKIKMIKPNFNDEKAIAVAAYLIKLQGNRCDKYWLAKVMYYVERESLIKNGQPLFFDELYSLPLGPIVSSVNDNIDSCSYPAESIWNHYFSLSNNEVAILNEPDYSIISTFEKNIIVEAYKKFRGWGFKSLHNYFEKLPEYKKTKGRIPIYYGEILSKVGYDEKAVTDTLEEISYITELESTLHCAV